MNQMGTFFKLARDARLWFVFLLGFCSGFPWTVTGSILTQFLVEENFSRSAIGGFGAIAVVYACNFLWAPLVDVGKFGYTGNRRSDWIVLCLATQAVLVCILGVFLVDLPILVIVLLILGISTGSATQDIAIDAWRIELAQENEENLISMAAVLASIGWWSGYAIPAAVLFFLTDLGWMDWSSVFLSLGMVYLLLLLLIWKCSLWKRLLPQNKQPKKPSTAQKLSLKKIFITPFLSFAKKYGSLAIGIILFIFLFKLGEAFLGRMSITFYNEVGFSKTEIATYSKVIGWGTMVIFSLIAGLIMVKFGLIKGLIIGGIAMASTNLMFAWIAATGPNIKLFFWTIVCDNFTSSFATVAFVAFLSYLCGRENTATEYAVLASIGNFGRTSLSGLSGLLVDKLDGNWVLFFIITAVMVLPSLFLLIWLSSRIKRLKT